MQRSLLFCGSLGQFSGYADPTNPYAVLSFSPCCEKTIGFMQDEVRPPRAAPPPIVTTLPTASDDEDPDSALQVLPDRVPYTLEAALPSRQRVVTGNHQRVVFTFTVVRLLWCLLFVIIAVEFALRANLGNGGTVETLFYAVTAVLSTMVLLSMLLPAVLRCVATLAEYRTVDDCLAEVCDNAVRMENYDQVWVAILAVLSVRLGLVHKKLKGWCVRDDQAFVIADREHSGPQQS